MSSNSNEKDITRYAFTDDGMEMDADGDYVRHEDWTKDLRTWNLVRLLIECRDALPAITVAAVRLHNIDPRLDKKIETAIAPWAIQPGDEGYEWDAVEKFTACRQAARDALTALKEVP